MEAVAEATQFDRDEQARQTSEAADNLTAKGCEVTYPELSGFVDKIRTASTTSSPSLPIPLLPSEKRPQLSSKLFRLV